MTPPNRPERGLYEMEFALLSEDELAAMDATVALVGAFKKIVNNGSARESDLREFVTSIHHIQSSILAQAASRAYPDRFRPLGGFVDADLGAAVYTEEPPAMSTIDKILEVLDQPTQQTDEYAMRRASDVECWRCGIAIADEPLGVCERCLTYLQSEATTPRREPLTQDEIAAVVAVFRNLGVRLGEACGNLARTISQAAVPLAKLIAAFGPIHAEPVPSRPWKANKRSYGR